MLSCSELRIVNYAANDKATVVADGNALYMTSCLITN